MVGGRITICTPVRGWWRGLRHEQSHGQSGTGERGGRTRGIARRCERGSESEAGKIKFVFPWRALNLQPCLHGVGLEASRSFLWTFDVTSQRVVASSCCRRRCRCVQYSTCASERRVV